MFFSPEYRDRTEGTSILLSIRQKALFLQGQKARDLLATHMYLVTRHKMSTSVLLHVFHTFHDSRQILILSFLKIRKRNQRKQLILPFMQNHNLSKNICLKKIRFMIQYIMMQQNKFTVQCIYIYIYIYIYITIIKLFMYIICIKPTIQSH